MERRYHRDQNLKKLHQQSIDTDVDKGFWKKCLNKFSRSLFGKDGSCHTIVCQSQNQIKWHHSKEVCPTKKQQAGLDILLGLIGPIFRFHEGPISLTADIKSFFCKFKLLNKTEAAWSFPAVKYLLKWCKYKSISATFWERKSFSTSASYNSKMNPQ